MKLRRRSARAARGSWMVVILVATSFACGGPTSSSASGPSPSSNEHPATVADAGSPSATSPSGISEPAASASEDASSGVDGETEGGGLSMGSAPEAGEGEGGEDAGPPDTDGSPPSCATGQVTPNEVVMLGDSYLDPAWGNVGPTIMMDANATYRHYYIGGAALAWGNPNTQFYIPYQFDPMALTDTSVTDPSDIKVVIMDGGGNDVLIGNTSCETTAPPGNTSCVTTVQNAVNEAKVEMQEMANKGVQSLVFFFYPHLSTAGGGILLTPAPAVNETLDYAYPLVEQTCCGSSFSSSLTQYSCSGQPVPGLTCVFIDTRPAFEGHLADYIKSDNVHPTQTGANVIANLVWTQMQAHCIAQ